MFMRTCEHMLEAKAYIHCQMHRFYKTPASKMLQNERLDISQYHEIGQRPEHQSVLTIRHWRLETNNQIYV